MRAVLKLGILFTNAHAQQDFALPNNPLVQSYMPRLRNHVAGKKLELTDV